MSILVGTPLFRKLAKGDNTSSSALRPWDQDARDGNGKRAFHGAFEGGLTAGYNNTAGSRDGWTPSTFYSSRSKKSEQKLMKPEDFMDEDDLRDSVQAGVSIKIPEMYSVNASNGKMSLEQLENSIGYRMLEKRSEKKEVKYIGPGLRQGVAFASFVSCDIDRNSGRAGVGFNAKVEETSGNLVFIKSQVTVANSSLQFKPLEIPSEFDGIHRFPEISELSPVLGKFQEEELSQISKRYRSRVDVSKKNEIHSPILEKASASASLSERFRSPTNSPVVRFKPFQSDSLKQQRFDAFTRKRSHSEYVGTSSEEQEFEQMYQTMHISKQHKQTKDEVLDRTQAAKMKLFGTLTRQIETWLPSPLLLKRFNMKPDPLLKPQILPTSSNEHAIQPMETIEHPKPSMALFEAIFSDEE